MLIVSRSILPGPGMRQLQPGVRRTHPMKLAERVGLSFLAMRWYETCSGDCDCMMLPLPASSQNGEV